MLGVLFVGGKAGKRSRSDVDVLNSQSSNSLALMRVWEKESRENLYW